MFENVTINGNYASIKIGTYFDNNFNFDLNLNYASFNYPEEKVTLKNSSKTNKKHYNGFFGEDTSESVIRIKSNYGSVSFKIND